MCFKITREDDDTKLTNITNKQMFKWSVKRSKDNEKMDNIIIDFKEYI